MAEHGDVDIVATLKDTAERRAFLTFTDVAAFTNPVAIFVRRDRPFAYQKWADLIGHSGGIARGNKFGGGFDEFLKIRLTVDEADNLATNFRKLGVGRIDYLITGFFSGQAWLAEQHRDADFMALQPFVTETQNLVGFVSTSPCVALLPEFQRRLAMLAKAGTPAAMLNDALQSWRAAPTLGQ